MRGHKRMHTQQAAIATSRARGRPPKADTERLSEVLNFRVTPREADSIYQYAIRHGEPLNVVLRGILRRFLAIKRF